MEEKEIGYILFDNNFMKWIIKKLKEHYYIDDNDTALKEEDFNESKNIKYLYRVVEEYASYNNIRPDVSMQFNIFYVDYDGFLFFVYEGVKSFGCFNANVDKKHLPFCIDFNDVRKFKLDEMIKNDDGIFNALNNYIVELHDKGISIDQINQVINRILHNIKKEEKGHTYKKK